MMQRNGKGLVLAVLLGVAGCGGGGSGGGGVTGGDVDLLLKDAPVEGLLAFRGTVHEVRLVKRDGTPSADLLPDDVAVELVGLQDRAAWLARVQPPNGSYVAVRIGLDASTLTALDRTGRPRTMNITSDQLEVPLSPPLVVGQGRRQLVVDLHLADSLEGFSTGSPVEFTPEGFLAAGDRTRLRPFPCMVVDHDGTSRVTVQGLMPSSQAELEVDVSTAQLLDARDQPSDAATFLAGLSAGVTTLKVTGTLDQKGQVLARRVEHSSKPGAPGAAVAMEGQVLNLRGNGSFDLLIQELVDGEDTADGVLAGLGDPASIPVVTDASTELFLNTADAVTSPRLRIGQRVHVTFAQFTTPPFPTSRVEIIHAWPRMEGTVFQDHGLPDFITIHLNLDDPLVTSGRVDSTTTPVRVDLARAVIRLDNAASTALTSADLLPGTRVEVRGNVSGPSSAPLVSGRSIVVRRGRASGVLDSLDQTRNQFTFDVSQIIHPFGPDHDGPLLTAKVNQNTVFRGDATSRREFFDLDAVLAAGDTVNLTVTGHAQRQPDQIVATGVFSEVRPRIGPLVLWPPNHKYASIDLDDLFGGRNVDRIEVDSITQDEPVNGKGDGNTSPDARGLGQSSVGVRAERSGNGNGRVYEIAFTIHREDGTRRQRTYRVEVPKSQNGQVAGDDGQVYDSTQR